MPMESSLRIERVEDWLGHNVVDVHGNKVGKLEDIVYAGASAPLLGAVSTGLLGKRRSLVPLEEATLSPNQVTVPFTKSEIKGSPQLDEPGAMTAALEDQTLQYYGRPPREHAPEERYDTATARMQRATLAAEAAARAEALEARADTLGADARAAHHDAESAQRDAEAAREAHEAAAAEAQAAREEQAKLLEP
jgi:hypothetical protein